MSIKFLTKGKRSLPSILLGALFALMAFKTGSIEALNTTDVVNNVNTVSSDIISVLKADGIKIAVLAIAWASVGLFALFHKPIGKATLGACVVTAVIVFMHKWA